MEQDINRAFAITSEELKLRFSHPPGERNLAFGAREWDPGEWKSACRRKLAELLDIANMSSVNGISPGKVKVLRQARAGGVSISALVMTLDEYRSLPAYLLQPVSRSEQGAVMAIHGHGEAEPCLGLRDDYHHAFALRLAEAGYTVLLPELRGFGALRDLGEHADGTRLDYWNWGEHMAYSLVTDGFLYGRTLIGDTVMDLLRWEQWLAQTLTITELDVAGISYGGDLALIYPVFSRRIHRIFASGTLGSFSVIFSRCYNAPAHCIPGILKWMDRADIAGLNAPRPIALHYGELDVPGAQNFSAAYNETVPASLAELRTIYDAFDAADAVHLVVSPGLKHEMDSEALITFLSKEQQ